MPLWNTTPRYPLDHAHAVVVQIDFREGGLHMTPSAAFCTTLRGLDISVYFRGPSYTGFFPHESALELMAFGGFYLTQACEFELTICGPDREAACDKLIALFTPENDHWCSLEGSCRRL